MFNTGDLGKWLEDGTIEHHGRLDDQVKIKVKEKQFALNIIPINMFLGLSSRA